MTHSTTSTPRVDVIASLAMEAHLRSLNLGVNFNFASPAMESQQLDEEKAKADLIAHHERLQKLLKGEKPTGTPQLFVLDPEKLAVGDLDSQTTLQALANAHLSTATKAAVAMLPPAAGYTYGGQAAATLVRDQILEDCGVATLESLDALTNWLVSVEALPAPVVEEPVEVVSTEAAEEIAEEGIPEIPATETN